jgi:hypothetical protein
MKGGKMAKGNLIGGWAFLIGVVLAVIVGAWQGTLSTTFQYILVIIGLIVGLLNIADKETMPFLTSGAILIIVSALGGNTMAGIQFLPGILAALLTLFVPATIVVAIKNVFGLARD